MVNTVETEITNIEGENNFLISEYVRKKLEVFEKEFRDYFNDKCKAVLDYFKMCPIGMCLFDWLFSELNLKRLPMSVKQIIKNVKGLSRVNGLSFIRQIKLADKLKCSDRWIRNIASRLKNIGLMFSIRTNKVRYAITFDLTKTASDYIDTVLAISFYAYSCSKKSTNTINFAHNANASNLDKNVDDLSSKDLDLELDLEDLEASSDSASICTSSSSSGYFSQFILAKHLFDWSCGEIDLAESLKILENQDNLKSKEGMHASVGSQPASQHFFINNFVAEEKEQLTVTNLCFNSIGGFDNNKTYKNTNSLKIVTNTASQNSVSKPSATTSTTYFVSVNVAASKAKGNNKSGTNSSDNNSNNNNSSSINTILKSPKYQEESKSIHSYELCEKYTIEYAKSKLGSNDEIDDIKAFATYCFRSGEKDAWITAFVENNYVITSYNPLKNNELEANDTSSSSSTSSTSSTKKKKSSNKRQPNSANETLRTENTEQPKEVKESKHHQKETEVEEILGKYPLNVYLDFIERVEEPRLRSLGREVYLAENLAKSMQNTGNDDKRVAKFVEQMKSASIGARANDFNFIKNNSFNSNNINSNSSLSLKANEFVERDKAIFAGIKEEFHSQIKIDSLRDELWSKLSVNEQQTLLNQEIKSLKSSKYFYSHYQYWTERKLEEQAVYQVKKALANDVILGQGTMVASPINATLNQ